MVRRDQKNWADMKDKKQQMLINKPNPGNYDFFEDILYDCFLNLIMF